MVIDSPSRQPSQLAGLAREPARPKPATVEPPFWDRIPEVATERLIATLRWIVPASLALITVGFEVREHWEVFIVNPLSWGDFSREVLLFGVLWPLSAFLLLSWLLRQWRLRRVTSEVLEKLYREVSQANRDLAALDQERIELLRRQVTVHEQERQRIATEIHDELGSLLTRLNTDLERLRVVHDGVSVAFDQQVEHLRTLVGQTVDRAHDLCVSLRPQLLEQLGLRAALRAEAQSRLTPASIAWQLNVQGDPRDLPPEISLVAFRIAQESFTNILRHAHASSVTIDLTQGDACFCMRIVDDGTGLACPKVGTHSLGLIGMRERAQAVGGTFAVQNAPGRGVEVTIHLPL